MKSLSRALAYAMAYIGAVRKSSDDDRQGVKATEFISHCLSDASDSELVELKNAAREAQELERIAKNPNFTLIAAYEDVISFIDDR